MIRADVRDLEGVEAGNQSLARFGCRRPVKQESLHAQEMQTIKHNSMTFGGNVVTKETLHDALDGYRDWIEKTFVDIEGRTTQTGKSRGSVLPESNGTPRTCRCPISAR